MTYNPIHSLRAGVEALSLPVGVVLAEPRVSAGVGVHHQALDLDQLGADAAVFPGQPLHLVGPPLLHPAEVLLMMGQTAGKPAHRSELKPTEAGVMIQCEENKLQVIITHLSTATAFVTVRSRVLRLYQK